MVLGLSRLSRAEDFLQPGQAIAELLRQHPNILVISDEAGPTCLKLKGKTLSARKRP